MIRFPEVFSFFFFFNDTATTEIYTLSLHDALPICLRLPKGCGKGCTITGATLALRDGGTILGRRSGIAVADRKSTRLNSSHMSISYAVFCLKKKKKNTLIDTMPARQATFDTAQRAT